MVANEGVNHSEASAFRNDSEHSMWCPDGCSRCVDMVTWCIPLFSEVLDEEYGDYWLVLISYAQLVYPVQVGGMVVAPFNSGLY